MQQVRHQITSSTPLQIPPQPEPRKQHPILLDTVHPLLPRAIVNPKKGTEGPLQLSPRACGSQGPGQACWSLDVRVTVVLVVTVAGALILLLLYRLLKLRHKLRVAKARHALQYHSFYHTATYTLKDPSRSRTSTSMPPDSNGNVPPEVAPAVPTETQAKPPAISVLPPPPASPPPPLPAPPTPVLPPPPAHPPPPLVVPRPPPLHASLPLLTLPLPLPVIHTTPPSPHLSWGGASSDADVYSRIGAYRPSRHSSLSTRSQVILFEHSSL